MIFSDEEILAGPNLNIPAIQSTNYVPGVSGWSIFKDGSAEFTHAVNSGFLKISSPSFVVPANIGLTASQGLLLQSPLNISGTYNRPAQMQITPGSSTGNVSPNVDVQAVLTVSGTRVPALGWFSVKDFGAAGDGVADDSPEIQEALNACPAGGVVFMPPGVYRTNAPITIPPYVTLMGSHGGNEAQSAGWTTPCSIKPLATFTGAAVVQVNDQQIGGYSRLASEIAIRNLTIDGSAIPTATTVDGIRATGQIQGLILSDVQVRNTTGVGINTAYNSSAPPGPQAPFCLHFTRVSVLWCSDIGVVLNNSTDSNFNDVYVLGCSGFGWYISGSDNTTMTGCRAEWSGSDGFRLEGGSGVLRMIGCSTDRNGQNGINITATANTGFVVITNAALTRDGKTSATAGFSGLNVTGCARKVIVDGLVVNTGADDGGTGLVSPQFGVSVTNSAYVAVGSGWIKGVSLGWHDAGGNTTLLRGTTVTAAP